jgi:hypothetical protein
LTHRAMVAKRYRTVNYVKHSLRRASPVRAELALHASRTRYPNNIADIIRPFSRPLTVSSTMFTILPYGSDNHFSSDKKAGGMD